MSSIANEDRCFDLEGLALAWYGQPLGRLLAGGDLVAPTLSAWPSSLEDVPGSSSGHLVAASATLIDACPTDAIVVGGPCIGDCSGFPTLEALADTVQVVLTARALRADCLLYLGDREEALGRGGAKSWLKLGERMAAWVEGIVAALGMRATIVRTSSPEHETALEAAGHPGRELAASEIDAAFQLGDESPWEGDETSRAVTARVIEAHLPSVVAAHLGRDPSPVVMAQNLQQVGAWRLARKLAAGTAQHIEFLGHWPVPSVSAAARMYRAEPWDKVQASALDRVEAGTLPGLSGDTEDYFRGWLDQDLRAALVTSAKTG